MIAAFSARRTDVDVRSADCARRLRKHGNMVGRDGIEPTNLLLFTQTLYQLSYLPVRLPTESGDGSACVQCAVIALRREMAERQRFER
jgi:hypothetical protein